MDNIITTIAVIVGVLLALFGASILFAVPVWLLWNWIVPGLFGLSKLTLLKAWGLTLLCGLLFKGSSTVKSTNK